jgi:hypothetical protein
MEKAQISLFSKIMAGLAIIPFGLILSAVIHNKDDLNIWTYVTATTLLFVAFVSILVIFSRVPKAIFTKIIFLFMNTASMGLIVYIFYLLSGELFRDFIGSLNPPFAFISFMTACFAIFWTVSIMSIHILKINRKIWVISSLSLFVITAIIAHITYIPPRDYRNNEFKARNDIGGLRGTQATWRQMDYDGNGIQDYWTYDISCFYRMKDKAGDSVKTIDVQYAKSDTSPAKDDVFGVSYIQESLVSTPTASAGYYFRAMLYDENGVPYNQNEVSPNKVKATNSSKWAFVAYPASYAMSGRRTFIINEEGITYSTDCGSFEKGIILQWPGKDPTKVKSPGGGYWARAE